MNQPLNRAESWAHLIPVGQGPKPWSTWRISPQSNMISPKAWCCWAVQQLSCNLLLQKTQVLLTYRIQGASPAPFMCSRPPKWDFQWRLAVYIYVALSLRKQHQCFQIPTVQESTPSLVCTRRNPKALWHWVPALQRVNTTQLIILCKTGCLLSYHSPLHLLLDGFSSQLPSLSLTSLFSPELKRWKQEHNLELKIAPVEQGQCGHFTLTARGFSLRSVIWEQPETVVGNKGLCREAVIYTLKPKFKSISWEL